MFGSSLSGFDRLPPGATPLDSHLMEMQRRHNVAVAQAGGLLPPSPHLPGVYPPTSLTNDLIARERERIERIGRSL